MSKFSEIHHLGISHHSANSTPRPGKPPKASPAARCEARRPPRSRARTKFTWRAYLVGGLEHEFYDFPYIGNVIIPTDELRFFRGVGIPPTSKNLDVLLSSVFSSHVLWLIWAYTIQYIWDTIHYENPCENQLVSRDSRGCFFPLLNCVYSR